MEWKLREPRTKHLDARKGTVWARNENDREQRDYRSFAFHTHLRSVSQLKHSVLPDSPFHHFSHASPEKQNSSWLAILID